ncbi:MAG TPA: DUF1778 domain-containing protein [Agitococcus sp.]|nr:DUF1778 domain-containing protein [Agitococcus sp.]HNG46281.1 DUF1778 domain-containing protein [Agitococcus sp.]HNP02147.1 DUF1778 domain-containing protein [Agitococcus sp.]
MSSIHQSVPNLRSSRLGLRATPVQEQLLKDAASLRHQSLTDFILDSACLAAEHTLLNQRLFMVSHQEYQNLLNLLDDDTSTDNTGLADLFSRQAPWEQI